jgi:hypothetical protein
MSWSPVLPLIFVVRVYIPLSRRGEGGNEDGGKGDDVAAVF